MHPITHTPPEAMTPDQRRHEIAGLLANGLARLRAADHRRAVDLDSESRFGLGFCCEESVHVNPDNNVVTQPK